MKKPAINYSWPVILSDFSQDSVNENFSRAKLWVYYKGQTADKRYFSDEFAEQIKKTLPYAPVVSYYDEEKEDFVGHAREQQIYGIVDPCVEPVFTTREEDGKEWCVAEVVLYTERPDKTGEIAQKIVGQPHSLELNPKTVKYVINYDEKKHFKNIEFTAGDFVGVSVLGKDQKPAFAGSAFFEANEEFENKMKLLREHCEAQVNNDLKIDGGENMNLEEFMKLSWGDISAKVERAICREYENDAYTYIVDMFEDSAIARFYYYVGGDQKLMRIQYSCSENGEISLGNINEVRVVYEDCVEVSPSAEINMKQVEEPDTTTDAVSDCTIDETIETVETTTNAEVTDVQNEDSVNPEDSGEFAGTKTEDDDEDKDDKDPEDDKDDKDPEDKEDKKDDDDDDKDKFVTSETVDEIVTEDTTSEPAQVTDVEITPTTETKVSVDDEQDSTIQETTSGSTSFTESERAEFEALKRKEKVDLINSYKDSLTDDEYADFMEKVADFTKDSLELELLKAYKRNQEENSSKPMRAFALNSLNNNANKQESTLDAFVRKHRR